MVDTTELGLVFRYEMALEPRARPDNQELARKPKPDPRIERVQKQLRGVAWLDPTAHWGKIFKGVLKNFKKKKGQPDTQAAIAVQGEGDGSISMCNSTLGQIFLSSRS
jgi:hypothetical protein